MKIQLCGKSDGPHHAQGIIAEGLRRICRCADKLLFEVIRLVKDEFCRHLVKRLRAPLVSTSANISGQPAPPNFPAVSEEIKNSVDHIVKWRQDDLQPSTPSQIIRWKDGHVEYIRK